MAASSFRQAGLSTAMIQSHAGTTGSAVSFTDESGEHCRAVHKVRTSCCRRPIQTGSLPGERGRPNSGLVRMTRYAHSDVLRVCTKRRLRTLLDPSRYRAVDLRLVARASILVLNEVEAENWAVSPETRSREGKCQHRSPRAFASDTCTCRIILDMLRIPEIRALDWVLGARCLGRRARFARPML